MDTVTIVTRKLSALVMSSEHSSLRASYTVTINDEELYREVCNSIQ